ncbi:MAG: MoxR family ATPase [Candidatus Acididesulfobacter guangdongensis]|uniref:MoxR family ATPase n=1 Tax=Acididesulfobacter guangdongensis TaxID=2597225 RepID=A0A519BFV0_ACIG2|nr:MAG: MoxR family ATPase [Candidatus Acididesulfobacter guangdongensis]
MNGFLNSDINSDISDINSARERIISIIGNLDAYFFERYELIEAILISIIAKQHMILIGEPGLAKTAILKGLIKHIKGMKLFDYQMTPHTEINDLLSDNPLNKGNGIDKCEIVLIDEFFKGKTSTLNSLLSIMNERILYNPEPANIPLISLFATSNEKPDRTVSSNLLPLYDRFLLRKEVLPIAGEDNFKNLLKLGEEYSPNNINLTLEELKKIIIASRKINIEEHIYNLIFSIREELKNRQVIVSDRRWRDTVKIIKAKALLEDRLYASENDIRAIESSMWTYYSDIRTVKSIINKHLYAFA